MLGMNASDIWDFVKMGMATFGLIAFLSFIGSFFLRRVVQPNEVHIVQTAKKTTSYGKDTGNGNTYYAWPSWLPFVGVTVTSLPVSVFNISLTDYEAYDNGRVPFLVDVIAFFRIKDTNLAAQRVTHFNDMQVQLTSIVKGAIRTVLAGSDINDIMAQRAKFGDAFTQEVENQLENWGVIPVKNIELMDMRDAHQSEVIANIMQKKKSLIESESRQEVAKNMQAAAVAEVQANREVALQQQEADQQVGTRTAAKEQEVGIAKEKAMQGISLERKATKDREMDVLSVQNVRQAEIGKQAAVIAADQAKQVQVLNAEGTLEAKKREAEGIQIAGLARAEAEKAMQLAPVQAQIVLADKIGSSEGYQKYLVSIRQVEASQAVGIEQAKALEKANIKIIANTGDPVSGVTKVMDLFSSKGGTSMSGMLEGLAQSDVGKQVLAKLGVKSDDQPSQQGTQQ
jgi:flotillin